MEPEEENGKDYTFDVSSELLEVCASYNYKLLYFKQHKFMILIQISPLVCPRKNWFICQTLWCNVAGL